jgi:hypothetical protein
MASVIRTSVDIDDLSLREKVFLIDELASQVEASVAATDRQRIIRSWSASQALAGLKTIRSSAADVLKNL